VFSRAILRAFENKLFCSGKQVILLRKTSYFAQENKLFRS